MERRGGRKGGEGGAVVYLKCTVVPTQLPFQPYYGTVYSNPSVHVPFNTTHLPGIYICRCLLYIREDMHHSPPSHHMYACTRI